LGANLTPTIQADGFAHFLTYAEPSDGTTASSVSTDYIDLVITLKATAQLNTRPTIIRVENFEGKVVGSVVENAHFAKRLPSAGNTVLQLPTAVWDEFNYSDANYTHIGKVDNSKALAFGTQLNAMAQQLFSFNLIEAVERNFGRIPRSTVADKVQWLKDNIKSAVAGWQGHGSSASGNKATFARFSVTGLGWSSFDITNNYHTNGGVSSLFGLWDSSISTGLDANGFVHYLAYAEPSDGVTPSTIITDYISLELTLKPTADFTRPKVALYEVAAENYPKILVDWDADEVVRRHPIVEGTQHLQGVGVVAEGENMFDLYEEFTKLSTTDISVTTEGEVALTSLVQFAKAFGKFKENTQYSMTYDIRYEHASIIGLFFRFEYTDGTFTSQNPIAVNMPHTTITLVSTAGKSVKSITNLM
jgi:hypothetical protein